MLADALGILLHGEAVQVDAPLDHIIVPHVAGHIGIHRAVDIKAVVHQVTEALVVPVKGHAEGGDEDVGVPHIGRDLTQPAADVVLLLLHGDGLFVPVLVVGVAVAGDLPAAGPESLGHRLCLVQHPLLGGLVKQLQVGDPVAEGPGIAGDGHDALGPLPGKLRMLPDIGVQDGHHVAVIGGLAALYRLDAAAVVHDGAAHDGDHVALVIHVQPAGKAVVQHIVVIVHVVDGQHQGLFAGGQVDILENSLAVHQLHHVGDVIEDEALLLQQGQHGLELRYGGHEHIIARGVVVAVKGLCGVGGQTVEEDVVILAAVVFHQALLQVLHVLKHGGGVGVGQLSGVFQQPDGIVIIIAPGQSLCLGQQVCPAGGQVLAVLGRLGVVLLLPLLLLLLAAVQAGQRILVVKGPHQRRPRENHRNDGHRQHQQQHRTSGAAALVGVFSSCHIVTS